MNGAARKAFRRGSGRSKSPPANPNPPRLVLDPFKGKLAEIRGRMMQNEDAVAAELRISPAMRDLVRAEFDLGAAH